MKRWILWLGLSCTLAGGCASQRARVESELPRYTVKRGDTLYSIAERFATSVEALSELNAITDPSQLAVGQVLLLPPTVTGVIAEQKTLQTVVGRRDPPLQCEAHGPAPTGRPASRQGFSWPVDGVILTRFGQLEGRRHDGLAIGSPEGTPVWASANGKVILAGEEDGYGKLVVVEHKGGWLSLYGSLARLCVGDAQNVLQGQLLGLVGDTSGVASPRLYFELRSQKGPVDPRPRLP